MAVDPRNSDLVQRPRGNRLIAARTFIETERADSATIGYALADHEGSHEGIIASVIDPHAKEGNEKGSVALPDNASLRQRNGQLAFVAYTLSGCDAVKDMPPFERLRRICDLLFHRQTAVSGNDIGTQHHAAKRGARAVEQGDAVMKGGVHHRPRELDGLGTEPQVHCTGGGHIGVGDDGSLDLRRWGRLAPARGQIAEAKESKHAAPDRGPQPFGPFGRFHGLAFHCGLYRGRRRDWRR